MKKQLIIFCLLFLLGLPVFGQSQKDSIKILKDSISVLQIKYEKVNNEKKDAVSTLAQIIYYEKIIKRRPTQKKYEHGWILRALKYYNLPTKK